MPPPQIQWKNCLRHSAESCDVRLMISAVSRIHCKLSVDENGDAQVRFCSHKLSYGPFTWFPREIYPRSRLKIVPESLCICSFDCFKLLSIYVSQTNSPSLDCDSPCFPPGDINIEFRSSRISVAMEQT